MIDLRFREVLGKAQHLLSQSPVEALHRLRVEPCGEMIRISGRVTTYYLKQQAQECIRPVTIGFHLRNDVRVKLTA
jgi:hypothetical protein